MASAMNSAKPLPAIDRAADANSTQAPRARPESASARYQALPWKAYCLLCVTVEKTWWFALRMTLSGSTLLDILQAARWRARVFVPPECEIIAPTPPTEAAGPPLGAEPTATEKSIWHSAR